MCKIWTWALCLERDQDQIMRKKKLGTLWLAQGMGQRESQMLEIWSDDQYQILYKNCLVSECSDTSVAWPGGGWVTSLHLELDQQQILSTKKLWLNPPAPLFGLVTSHTGSKVLSHGKICKFPVGHIGVVELFFSNWIFFNFAVGHLLLQCTWVARGWYFAGVWFSIAFK